MNPSHGSHPYPSGVANEAAVTPRSNVLVPAAPTPPRSTPAVNAAVDSDVDIDVRLVRGMRAGDENALGAFYDRWFPVVNCLTTRMLRAPGDVEDVVEEIFWQAWRQADRFDPARGSVQSWLLTMARSRALDRLRAVRRRHEEPIADHPGVEARPADASATDPSLAVEHAERKRLVLAALAELPAEQREALELGYFGGLSQSEIAERTGLPLGTVKTRMRLAMLKLRERLSALREDPR